MKPEKAIGKESALEPASRADGLGTTVTSGAAWTILFSGGGKVASFLSQIVIAWFLLPEEMGLAVMALSVSAITSFLSAGHIKSVLVQRQRKFEDLIGHGFWLALLIGVGFSAVYIIAAPLLGAVYDAPVVTRLVYILAAVPPLSSIAVIYSAVLEYELRFKKIAIIHFVVSLIVNGGMVTLAALGFGAYAIVLPRILGEIVSVVGHRIVVGRIPIHAPDWTVWGSLLLPAIWLGVKSLSEALMAHGSNFIIGVVHDSQVTGLYYWGYALSAQAIFLLARNLRGVFFPAFAKLNQDPKRQYQAFEKTSRILFAVIIPICMLQLLLAEPIVKLLFPDRWLPAVPVVQWLSVGMAAQPMAVLMMSVLKARGHFRALGLVVAGNTLFVLLCTSIGAQLGTEATIACWTGIGLLAGGLFQGWVSFREYKRGWSTLLVLYGPILLAGTMSGIIGYVLIKEGGMSSQLGIIAIVTSLTLISYSFCLRVMCKTTFEESKRAVSALITRTKSRFQNDT